mgnify:FL=1
MRGHTIDDALTLESLNRLIGALITTDATQNVWVTAELSDVAVRGGHCYLELLQKDPATGRQTAKARGIIWANLYPTIAGGFMAATGQQFASGIKLMVRASATFHPVFGLSLVISAVNPEYTMGDLMRRRMEILKRLKAEGILEDNRNLSLPDVPQRIAVISAPGAAGYGDFINQLFNNQHHLRFDVKLFPAIMQGEKAPASIIASLEDVLAEDHPRQCVVIIRGGGATSDLQAFEDYDLAASIAQFPLPVIIGIGHERDITVLDYVANMRVKTPTAAAEWLIARGADALNRLQLTAATIASTVSERISGCLQQLAYFEGILPTAPLRAVERGRERLNLAAMTLSQSGDRRIGPERMRLQSYLPRLEAAVASRLASLRDRLDSDARLLDALSPQATLNRGYSITRLNGHAVTDATTLSVGDTITTIFASGEITSTVTS